MDCPDAIAGQEEPAFRDKDGEEVKLRTVSLPEDLISKFLEIAKANSDRNIETLGTFGGQLCNNKFRVTHLPNSRASLTAALWRGMRTCWSSTRRRTSPSWAGSTPTLPTASSCPAWTCTTSTRGSVCFLSHSAAQSKS